MILTFHFRFLLSIVIGLALSGCQEEETIEDRASAAGCGALASTVEMFVVEAGLYDGIQDGFESNIEKYGEAMDNYVYFNAGLPEAEGKSSSTAVKAAFAQVGINLDFDGVGVNFSANKEARPEQIGYAFANGFVTGAADTDFSTKSARTTFVNKCGTFVGEYLLLEGRMDWAVDLHGAAYKKGLDEGLY
jgi:hypothetical protein